MWDLLGLVRKIQADPRIPTLDEPSTKQLVILPLLNKLGWDPFSIGEIQPEYSVGGKKVDYSLRVNNLNKVFIEVKQTATDLSKHQEQLLNYSFSEGIKLSILTDGITWWFYLPLHEGNWEQRKFYTIVFHDQQAEEIAQKFTDFLLKDNIISGKAIENAESVFKSKQTREIIQRNIPKAWNKLVTEQDEALIELVAITTEKLSGYKPEASAIAGFLSANPSLAITSSVSPFTYERPQSKKQETEEKRTTKRYEATYSYSVINSFMLKGIKYEVNDWRDVLTRICEIMYEKHRDQFSRVLELKGQKYHWFSTNQSELSHPERIDESDFYVQNHWSARGIVSVSRATIALFGYSQDDFVLDFEKKS